MPFAQRPRLGLCQFASFPGAGDTAEQVIGTMEPLLAGGFLTAIELFPLPDPGQRRHLAAALAERDLQVMFAAGRELLPYGHSLCANDPAMREAALAVVRPLIQQAVELGARNVLVVSGPDPGPEHQEAAAAALAESLVALARHAERCSPHQPPVITLEHFDRTGQWRQFAGPSALAAQVVGAARDRGALVGITLDMSHVAQLDEDLAGATRRVAPYLVHAHVANAVVVPGHPLFGDLHVPFNTPGSAFRVADMVDYLRGLAEVGYFDRPNLCGNPVVSTEVKPLPGADPAEVAIEAVSHLQEAWDLFMAGGLDTDRR